MVLETYNTVVILLMFSDSTCKPLMILLFCERVIDKSKCEVNGDGSWAEGGGGGQLRRGRYGAAQRSTVDVFLQVPV